MTRMDFAAVNRRGVTVRTFGNLLTAVRWTYKHRHEHDGLHVVTVTTIVRTKEAYRPRRRLAA